MFFFVSTAEKSCKKEEAFNYEGFFVYANIYNVNSQFINDYPFTNYKIWISEWYVI